MIPSSICVGVGNIEHYQAFGASATLVNHHGNASNYLPWNHSMVSPREIYRICETTSWSHSPIAEHERI